MDQLENLKDDFFEDLTLTHTEFQINNFILGDEQVTVWGKYKQSLREIHKRLRGLKDINYQIEKKKIEIERLKRKVSKDDLDEREIGLDLDYEQDNLVLLENSKKDVLREGAIFLKAHDMLKEQIVGDKDELEKDFWIKKFKSDIETSIYGSLFGINPGVMKAISSIQDKNVVNDIMKSCFSSHVSGALERQEIVHFIEKNCQR